MTFLLDVNVLIALGWRTHEHHERAEQWMKAHPDAYLATCSITELGFTRILSQTAAHGVPLTEAREFLVRWKSNLASRHRFLSDDHDISRLPSWVEMPRQITDGHLLQLAQDHGAKLATLDRKIPGAHLIP